MTAAPRLTVIVPVLNGMKVLPLCIEALHRSTLPRDAWELIVADDGSTDGTGEWARDHADRVIRVDGGPRGPGFARNTAAAHASGDVLVFVDADVCVHPDTLARIRDAFTGDPGPGAVFGSYDDRPGEPGFLSQYRNLYHRYVHLRGAGEAETFWAGCGAVRRDLFVSLRGFDVEAFPRPQIEDIELGYRIRDAGHGIVLDPEISCTHLKRWSLSGIVRTDLLDRGIPWMQLLLGRKRTGTLNIGGLEKLKTALVGLACTCVVLAAVLADRRLLVATALPVAAVVALNLPLYLWFARLKGWWFALRVVPMNLLYYFISGCAVAVAGALHLAGKRRFADTSDAVAMGATE